MIQDSHLDLIAKKYGQETMKDLLIELLKKNMSLEACSEHLELSIYLIRKLLKKHLIVREPKAKIKLTLVEIKNNTLGQLARRYGVSTATIWRIKKDLIANAKDVPVPAEGS